MITELEKEIRDLQKELAEIKKDQFVLRLQPCRGDSEMKGKDAKYDELGRLAHPNSPAYAGTPLTSHPLSFSWYVPRT